MELILAHHEIFLLVMQYGLSLILGALICFKWLFPMLGQWIIDLCNRFEEWDKEMEKERLRVLGKQMQRRKDDRFYLDENDIEECSDSIKHI